MWKSTNDFHIIVTLFVTDLAGKNVPRKKIRTEAQFEALSGISVRTCVQVPLQMIIALESVVT